ncbi:MAG: LamG-like jellyroll fold domain-containing protein, partial [Chitinivibrionales bacterium]
ESNAPAVFDTSNNFSGVWHLNENPGSGQNSIKDRTVNKYDASPNGGMDNTNSVEGIIGKAIHFDGVGEYLIIKRPIQDDFTVGFWMRADSLSPTGTQWWQGDGLVDGDVSTPEPQNDFGVTYLNNKPVFGTCCLDTTLQASVLVNDAQWHYVVATRIKSSGVKTIFVDGKNTGNQTGTTNSLTGPDSLCFAKVLANITYFKGYLDEIQISKIARSADWITLCYMNQKETDALVVFKP